MNNVQQETMNVNPDVLVCVRAANALLRENRIDEAKVQVEQALKLDPNNTTMMQLYKQITFLENTAKQKSFEHINAQRYEFDFSKSQMNKEFLSLHNSFEKTRSKGEKLAGWCMDSEGVFANEKELWERFAEYLNDKTCLEIGSGPDGVLCNWWWVKNRIIIEPLIKKYRDFQLKNYNKTWFTDDIKCYALCAEEFVPSLSNAIDGVILCINVLDHCEDPMLVLQNIAKYAKPGCGLFLWTTLWRSYKCDNGHRNITIDKVAFEKNIIDLGFDVFSTFDKHILENEMMGYGCRAVKRG